MKQATICTVKKRKLKRRKCRSRVNRETMQKKKVKRGG